MDKTKSKLAAFFDKDDEETSFPQKPVDDQKLSHYTQGTVRKSKREKEKEAAEAKRREEEENAAKAYAEFLDAFQGDDADARQQGSAFVKSGQGVLYEPSVKSRGESSKPAQIFEEEPSPSPPPASRPKGKRAMDSFLEEIKREQAARESKFGRHAAQGRSITSMAAYEGQSGSKDRGDPETSNVFVANLPPHVNEQSLGMFFARVGPVGSVKIMWPRGDGSVGPGADMTASRRSKNSGLSGFVAFMKRKDAEKALRELDGFDWGGSVLRVGWSKAVPVAAKPMYVVKKSRSRSRPRSDSRSPQRYRSRSRSRSRDRGRGHHSRRSYSSSNSRSRSRSRSQLRSRQQHHHSYGRLGRYNSRSPRSHLRSPEREEAEVSEQFIRTVAAEVKGHGAEYAKSLREREQSNPKYSFIRPGHRKYKHFRSLVEQSRPISPEFDDEGYNSVYSTDSAEESERERVRKTQLGKLARRRFEAMLRSLSGRRGELARCMAFSLEHAEAASEVVDIIISSLLVDGTPVPRKVARLHLICDILHNSAVPLPMAWKFRQEFQSRLGIVFDHLSTIYHSFPGRITAETFKNQITAIVDIWEDWIVFPPDYTAELRERLEGMTVPEAAPQEEEAPVAVPDTSKNFASKFKSSSFQPAAEVPAAGSANEEDGEPMDVGSDDDSSVAHAPAPAAEEDVDGVPLATDVDGEPIAEDVDGEPMDDVDGEPIGDGVGGERDDLDGGLIKDNLDGEPMADEDVDGVPLDDDIDGAPVEV